ncbi:hypothetical protein RJ640_025347 [Escallonia rubra]|uniref:Uncharacterized protein n=1 Tax=Escallonia rubra TaxID=112253 RepID=A0AA88QMW4_9ASTE|nr:hypothetical protein RJ640_025347 [Escallonia rubra]
MNDPQEVWRYSRSGEIDEYDKTERTRKFNKTLSTNTKLAMLKRGATAISIFSNSIVVAGWYRPRRRLRRQKGGTIRLGNKRRVFGFRSRPVVHWGVVVLPFRLLKKIIMDLASNGRLMEACYVALTFLRPQMFPLC